MEIVQKNIDILPNQNYNIEEKYKWSKYCILVKDKNDNYAVHNFLNDSIISFNKNEIKENKEFLVNKWFLVPENFDELPNAKIVKNKFTNKSISNFDIISSYTIMTTTDCNAQCYYCYEFGRKKIPMSEKVANDLVDYMIKKYNGNSIRIRWFGGEPLYNEKIIDLITTKLKDNNINYSSSMISNAYLFEETKVNKYINDWNLKSIQITLDGYGDSYNRIKNYIYEEDNNAFDRVINNIDFLVNNKIRVSIRLNLSSINKEEIIKLIDFCHSKWANNRYFSMYAHNIFDEEKSEDEDLLNQIYNDLSDVNNLLVKYKFKRRSSKPKRMFNNVYCMANSGKSIVVNPMGQLGVCEHYSESEMFGSIYSEYKDENVIKEWLKYRDDIDICFDCPLYPVCKKLKKCENSFCNKYKKTKELKEIKFKLRKFIKK